MRHVVSFALALVSCTTRTDAPIDAQPPIPREQNACTDVAAATLDLADATPQPVEGCGPDVVAVALTQDTRWTLTASTLEGAEQSFPLVEIAPTDVAAGHADTAFVLDGSAGAIHRAESGGLVRLATDPSLIGARALVRIGGSLFVGTPEGLITVDLADAEVSVVREGLDVLDITVDDVGALVVLTSDGFGRMLPSGADVPISAPDVDARRIAFDLVADQLLVVDESGSVQRIDYPELVPEGPSSRPIAHGEMGPFLASGYVLAGAEYWPHRGSTPAEYPGEILWGFYPHEGEVFEGAPALATATDAAVGCAERSYAALKAWIPTATDALADATADGKARRFYLWVNDYSEADDPFPSPMRQAKLWYWAREPAVAGRIPGYFKWETVVDQRGECRWPQPEQAMAFLEEAATSSAE